MLISKILTKASHLSCIWSCDYITVRIALLLLSWRVCSVPLIRNCGLTSLPYWQSWGAIQQVREQVCSKVLDAAVELSSQRAKKSWAELQEAVSSWVVYSYPQNPNLKHVLVLAFSSWLGLMLWGFVLPDVQCSSFFLGSSLCYCGWLRTVCSWGLWPSRCVFSVFPSLPMCAKLAPPIFAVTVSNLFE